MVLLNNFNCTVATNNKWLNIQLFGGGGGSSGGNFKGINKSSSHYKKNSSYTQYKNGKKYQTRWYDRNGNPYKDMDYTNHGNSKKHPVTPHYHDWIDGKRGDGYYLDNYGNKKYFK